MAIYKTKLYEAVSFINGDKQEWTVDWIVPVHLIDWVLSNGRDFVYDKGPGPVSYKIPFDLVFEIMVLDDPFNHWRTLLLLEKRSYEVQFPGTNHIIVAGFYSDVLLMYPNSDFIIN
jgi:hypothetical protein